MEVATDVSSPTFRWGARLCEDGRPAPPDSVVSVVVESVGAVRGRIAPPVKHGFEVSFDLSDEQRDALLLKLYSGRYRTGPEKTNFSDVIAAVALRMAR